MKRRSMQSGVALLVVLWACTLLAILAGGYASLAHVESEQARYTLAMMRARYAAEAGVMRGIHDVYAGRKAGLVPGPEQTTRWMGDGQPWSFKVDGARVTVTVEDEAGKIDLNAADPAILMSLFMAAGANQARARRLADDVVIWRTTTATPDADAIKRYESAGRPYAPRQARFPSVEELQSVLGMDAALFAKVEPALTLWSGLDTPVPYYAPVNVLSALPNMPADIAKAYVNERSRMPIGTLVTLPGNLPGGWTPGSAVVTIESTGVVTENISVTLRVTVRYDQLNSSFDPRLPLFTILRWRNMPRA